ncbi:tetratricopeptide repeat protein, partial [bacterium]|nr:tetratricopeptide repeat protein [bacterium]
FPAALKEYETATELQPGYARAWNFRGDALQALSRFDEAADSYRRAIELDPEYASPATKLRQLELTSGE